MAYGLTDSGFVKKRQPEIQVEVEAALRGKLGASLNLLPTTVLGQTVGIYSEREALLWEILEDIYNSQFPDTATGISLDNAVALTGTTRLPATFSTGTLRVIGTLGTFIPALFVASVSGVPTNRFQTVESGTIGVGTNEIQELTFSAVPASGTWQLTFDGQTTSALAFNANNAAIAAALNALSNLSGVIVTGGYSTQIAVEFSGADGQQEQPLLTISGNSLQDGGSTPVTITVEESEKGWLPFVDLLVRAEVTGARTAPSGSLTVIETPLFGVDSVTNILDINVGRERETAAELRIRRLESLQRAGTATVNGIVTTMRQIPGVETAFVFENNTDATVGGRPPKSYEVYVQGGVDQEILDAVWETKPAGIQTVGNFSGTVFDSQGFLQTVYFSRPAEILIWLDITITKNTDPSEPGGVYPANGDQLVRDAVLAYGAGFEIGQDVVISRFYSIINTIPGIVGIAILADTIDPPVGTTNISIDGTEFAKFDASRTTVTSV